MAASADTEKTAGLDLPRRSLLAAAIRSLDVSCPPICAVERNPGLTFSASLELPFLTG